VGLLPGPTTLILETFDSPYFCFRFVSQGLEFGVDLLPRTRGSAAGGLIGPDGFHHPPEAFWLDWFSDRLDGHVHWSCGKVKFLSQLQRSVRQHSAFNDDNRGIHDIHRMFFLM
jgi:hypothetical protein